MNRKFSAGGAPWKGPSRWRERRKVRQIRVLWPGILSAYLGSDPLRKVYRWRPNLRGIGRERADEADYNHQFLGAATTPLQRVQVREPRGPWRSHRGRCNVSWVETKVEGLESCCSVTEGRAYYGSRELESGGLARKRLLGEGGSSISGAERGFG